MDPISDKFSLSRVLRRWKIGEMYRYFNGMTGHGPRSKEILGELNNAELFGYSDSRTCEDFRTWFTKIDLSDDAYYDEFRTLCASDSFYDLCGQLYRNHFLLFGHQDRIPLMSSKGLITNIDKRVAAAESEVLSDFTGDYDDYMPPGLVPQGNNIPLTNFSFDIVSEITHFMTKKHDFSRQLKNLVNNYKGWFTQYLKLNRTMLPQLHDAAEFLNIKSLFGLTGRAVRELGGRTIEEITEWCGKLPFSEMLSSLVVGVEDNLQVDVVVRRLWPFA